MTDLYNNVSALFNCDYNTAQTALLNRMYHTETTTQKDSTMTDPHNSNAAALNTDRQTTKSVLRHSFYHGKPMAETTQTKTDRVKFAHNMMVQAFTEFEELPSETNYNNLQAATIKFREASFSVTSKKPCTLNGRCSECESPNMCGEENDCLKGNM